MRIVTCSALLAGLVLAAPPALAQTQTQTQPAPAGTVGRGACKQDIASYCSGVQRGGGKLVQCLKENTDKLSDGCKTAMSKMATRRQNAPAKAN